jgi:hypothetical protein
MPARVRRRLWYLLNRRRLERELEREMASHRAMMAEPHRFGSALRLREANADVWGWRCSCTPTETRAHCCATPVVRPHAP